MSDPVSDPSEKRRDPIGDKYFKPLERAEKYSDWLFYVAAALSIAALLVEKSSHPNLYELTQICFVLAVIGVFVLGIVIRVHWRPLAEDKRRSELISNSSKVFLTVEQTQLYYNNEQSDPTKRLGVITLENSHFSKAIALEMLTWERIKVGGYIIVFLTALLYRRTDLAVAATVAQAILSEQIISHWIRLEWLRARFQKTYDQLYSLMQSNPAKQVLYARVLESFAYYETGKSNAGISLSSKIFFQRNAELSEEWEKIKKTLKL
jgi:hypothetical protein